MIIEHQDIVSTDSVSDFLPLLADSSCLETLRQLRDRPSEVTNIHDLASDLPERSHVWSGDPNLRLYRVILPNLADANLVEFDPDSQTVQYGVHGPFVRRLDRIDEEST